MALSSEQLRVAGELIEAAASLHEAAALWRARYPAVRLVLVDAAELRDEVPALQLAGQRRLYLAASNGHCWQLTTQPEQASALILTQDEC